MKVNEELFKVFVRGGATITCNTKEEVKNIIKYVHNSDLVPSDFRMNVETNNINFRVFSTGWCSKTFCYSDIFMKDEIYTASELIHMIEENKLSDDDTLIDKENNEYTFSDAIDNWNLEGLIQFAPYKIKRCKYVSWEDAIKSNKLFKYKTWKNFYEASEVIKLLPSNQAKEMINSNNWVLYNFNK